MGWFNFNEKIIFLSMFSLAGCASISPGEMAISYSMGKVENKVYSSGVYFQTPLIQSFVSYSSRQQVHQEELDNLTKDLQSLKTTVIVKYTLNSANLPNTYKTVADSNEGVYNNHVRPLVLSTFKSRVSQHDLYYIADNWNKFADEVENDLKSKLQRENIVSCDSVELTGLKLDPDFTKAIEEKQRAQQRFLQSEIETKIAVQEAKRNIILTESLSYKVILKDIILKWDGKGPLFLPDTQLLLNLGK